MPPHFIYKVYFVSVKNFALEMMQQCIYIKGWWKKGKKVSNITQEGGGKKDPQKSHLCIKPHICRYIDKALLFLKVLQFIFPLHNCR